MRGEQSLNYYADYFGTPYPLPKLDMIGVPGAGGFGAMENWGAILYFDQYLLVDETFERSRARRTCSALSPTKSRTNGSAILSP